MASILMEVVYNNPRTYFVDPDGGSAPVTLQFPQSGTVQANGETVRNGSRIRIVNHSTSNTPITLEGLGGDTVADPQEIMEFATTKQITTAELMVMYQLAGTQWRVISHGDPDLAKNSLSVFSFAAYAGISLSTPAINPGNLGPAWVDITGFDQNNFTAKGIVPLLGIGQMQMTYEGIYQTNILLNYTHDEQNASRTTSLRIYNHTAASPVGNGILIPIARNQSATLIGISFLFEVPFAAKNHALGLQIGNGDVVVINELRAASWDMHAVSEWKETL